MNRNVFLASKKQSQIVDEESSSEIQNKINGVHYNRMDPDQLSRFLSNRENNATERIKCMRYNLNQASAYQYIEEYLNMCIQIISTFQDHDAITIKETAHLLTRISALQNIDIYNNGLLTHLCRIMVLHGQQDINCYILTTIFNYMCQLLNDPAVIAQQRYSTALVIKKTLEPLRFYQQLPKLILDIYYKIVLCKCVLDENELLVLFQQQPDQEISIIRRQVYLACLLLKCRWACCEDSAHVQAEQLRIIFQFIARALLTVQQGDKKYMLQYKKLNMALLGAISALKFNQSDSQCVQQLKHHAANYRDNIWMDESFITSVLQSEQLIMDADLMVIACNYLNYRLSYEHFSNQIVSAMLLFQENNRKIPLPLSVQTDNQRENIIRNIGNRGALDRLVSLITTYPHVIELELSFCENLLRVLNEYEALDSDIIGICCHFDARLAQIAEQLGFEPL